MNTATYKKGIEVAAYFVKKYGENHAKFICSRIATGLETYTTQQLIDMGDKIAFFNDWVSLEELQKRGL